MTSGNNKRIAKNTIFLYARMLITMVVGLYASRVILQTLGISDFGIYNVVAGIVTLFTFLVNTMASASQRFFAYEIGKKDSVALKNVFSLTVSVYAVFSGIILILGETVGLWFVINKLNIPFGREDATFWVYQLALGSLIFSVVRIPFNAMIIAHERMSFFAWSSIIEALLKLIAVLALQRIEYDSLITYSVLMLVVVLVMTAAYLVYCLILFDECRYKFLLDWNLLKPMFDFAGWNLFASIANLGANQGINILLNIFFNPAINAARGIAFQVSSQVMSLVGNFQTAASPQIIKYYARGEIEQMKDLYYTSSRLSFYLLYIIALPVLLEMDYLLTLWLGEVPDYTSLFARLVIITTLIDCLSGTSVPVVQATGNVKYYQIFVGSLVMLNVPVSYYFLKIGFPPQSTMIVSIVISTLALFIRLEMVKKLLGFSISEYLSRVVAKSIIITISSSIIPVLLFWKLGHAFSSFFIVVCSGLVTVLIAIYYFGLEEHERNKVWVIVHKRLGI